MLREKIGAHLHVVVEEDDDRPAREIDAALAGDSGAGVLLPLDAMGVLRLHVRECARVLFRTVVDRDRFVFGWLERLRVELREQPSQ